MSAQKKSVAELEVECTVEEFNRCGGMVNDGNGVPFVAVASIEGAGAGGKVVIDGEEVGEVGNEGWKPQSFLPALGYRTRMMMPCRNGNDRTAVPVTRPNNSFHDVATKMGLLPTAPFVCTMSCDTMVIRGVDKDARIKVRGFNIKTRDPQTNRVQWVFN